MGIIRLLLAIAVFNSHFPFLEVPVVDGHEAVLAFFAISGFYMALILDKAYTTAGSFYAGRFLSLYPIYLFALTLSVALLATWDIHPMTGIDELGFLLADPLSFFAMLWTSACLVGQELLFSLALSPDGGLHFVEASRNAIWIHTPMIHAWSLSLEIMFYALAPLLVRGKTATLVGLVVVSLVVKIAIVTSSLSEIVFFKRFFPAELWLFGSGILAYRLSQHLPDTPRITDALFFATLAITVFFVGVAPDDVRPFALPAATLMALPPVFRMFKQSRFDRLIGKISYPFYLLHFSIIAIFEECFDEPTGWHILVAALSAATLVHLLFNPGIEFLKQKIRKHELLAREDVMAHQPEVSTLKP